MVHRDIKPANLLITQAGIGPEPVDNDGVETSELSAGLRPMLAGGVVKILDFGLAKLETEHDATRHLTKTGQVMGTPDYISPEQAQSTRDADIRCDLYSLGCVLFYLVGGRVPFADGGMMDRLMEKATRDAPRLCSLCSETPPAVDDIVAKLLSRDPDERYQTPAELALALSPFC